jgi:prepilin-type N-terminal cleavage/methylation domain-containing protein
MDLLNRNSRAFTLLELIVVIVILGVLALIAIPTFQTVITRSKESAAQRSAESVGRNAVALAAFDQKTNVFGSTAAPDVTAADGYLDKAGNEAGLGPDSGTVNPGDGTIIIDTGSYTVPLTIVGAKVTAGTPSAKP